MIIDNPFAFPCVDQRDANGCGITEGAPGMTLRDYFAGQVLAGLSANQEWMTIVNSNGFDVPAKMGKASYQIADAMLAERAKGGAA